MKKEKQFEKPVLEIMAFANEEIIRTSGEEPTDVGGDNPWSELY